MPSLPACQVHSPVAVEIQGWFSYMLSAYSSTSTGFACLGSHRGWKVVSLLTFLFTCVMQALQMHNESASDFPVKLMITLSLFL